MNKINLDFSSYDKKIDFSKNQSVSNKKEKILLENIKGISNINDLINDVFNENKVIFFDMLISPNYIEKKISDIKSKIATIYGFSSYQHKISNYLIDLNKSKILDELFTKIDIVKDYHNVEDRTIERALEEISIVTSNISNITKNNISLNDDNELFLKMGNFLKEKVYLLDPFFFNYVLNKTSDKRKVFIDKAVSSYGNNCHALKRLLINSEILDSHDVTQAEFKLKKMFELGKLTKEEASGISHLIKNYYSTKLNELCMQWMNDNRKYIEQEYKYILIAMLNNRLNLSIKALDQQSLNQKALLNRIYNLSLDIESRGIVPLEKEGDFLGYSEEHLKKWADFLQKNKFKTDVFTYVNRKNFSKEEKDNLIKKLIAKNTSGLVNLERVFYFIDNNKLFESKNITEAFNKLSEIHNNKKLSFQNMYGVYKLVETHFFRNTSKLGIDFFKENKILILSSWNKPDGILLNSKAKKITLEDINHKFYNENLRRNLNGKAIHEPITYSEIRHMLRKYKNDTDGITRIFMDEDFIEFAAGIDKGQWIKHDKSTLRNNGFH